MNVVDRLAACCGVDGSVWATVGVGVVYLLLVGYARRQMVRDPLRAYLRTQFDGYERDLRASDRPGSDELAEALRGLSAQLEGRTVAWRGAADTAAGELRVQALAHLAAVGDDATVRMRAALLHADLAAVDDASPLLAPLRTVADGGPVDEGTRLLLSEVTTRLQAPHERSLLLQLRAHRKAAWLVSSGVFLVIVVAWTLGSPLVMAAGALGAFVSRLLRFVTRDDASGDERLLNRLPWTALMAGPVLGALAAYGGVLLIELLVGFGVLGETFAGVTRTVTDGAMTEVTLAIAFLFGFSERLLDRVATTAGDTVAAEEPADPSPPPAVPPVVATAEAGTVIDLSEDVTTTHGAGGGQPGRR